VTRALARFSRGVRNTINSVVNRSKFPESLCDQINQAIPNVEKAVAPWRQVWMRVRMRQDDEDDDFGSSRSDVPAANRLPLGTFFAGSRLPHLRTMQGFLRRRQRPPPFLLFPSNCLQIPTRPLPSNHPASTSPSTPHCTAPHRTASSITSSVPDVVHRVGLCSACISI
jgi:hypothetical protein